MAIVGDALRANIMAIRPLITVDAGVGAHLEHTSTPQPTSSLEYSIDGRNQYLTTVNTIPNLARGGSAPPKAIAPDQQGGGGGKVREELRYRICEALVRGYRSYRQGRSIALTLPPTSSAMDPLLSWVQAADLPSLRPLFPSLRSTRP
uniref:Uncharacterized protein n=1 Tax=Oryza glaberrima TaxID=4538 RepID=I1Q218_ORYGL